MEVHHWVKIETTIGMTDEDVIDLMVTALEGGIGYWACLDNTSQAFWDAPEDESIAETAATILLSGEGITLLDTEDHSVSWVLTLDDLLKGVKMLMTDDLGKYCSESIYGYLTIDMGMVDADAADSIVQYALFDEIVYG